MMGSQGETQNPLWLQELTSLWHEDNPRLLPAFGEAPPRPWEETSRHLPLTAWFGESVSLMLGRKGDGYHGDSSGWEVLNLTADGRLYAVTLQLTVRAPVFFPEQAPAF